jgi:hypothetical protein
LDAGKSAIGEQLGAATCRFFNITFNQEGEVLLSVYHKTEIKSRQRVIQQDLQSKFVDIV